MEQVRRDVLRRLTSQVIKSLKRQENLSSLSPLFPVYRPFFVEETLEPEIVDLFLALLDACLARSENDPNERSSENRWKVLVRLGTAHPDVCLPPMRERMKDDGYLALLLIVSAPGRLDRNRVDLAFDKHQGRDLAGNLLEFGAENSGSVLRTGASVFSRTVISHAHEAPEEDIEEYCRKTWPRADAGQIARHLVGRMPSLFDQDDFHFAYSWMLEQMIRRHGATILYGFGASERRTLSHYLQRFPNGRHAGLAKEFAADR